MKRKYKARSPPRRIRMRTDVDGPSLAKNVTSHERVYISTSKPMEFYRRPIIHRSEQTRRHLTPPSQTCYLNNFLSLHRLPDTKSLMLKCVEKELSELNLEKSRLVIGCYSWLFKDMVPLHELVRKYDLSDQAIKYILSDM